MIFFYQNMPMIVVLASFLSLFSVVESSSSLANIPTSELNSLYDLYVATNGSGWSCCTGISVRWDFSNMSTANPCADDWEGVSCVNTSSSNNFISGLALNETRLHGTIPTSIGDLSYLSVIDFTDNVIGGTIPSSLSNCVNLTEIEMGFNYLTGSIPLSLGQLVQMTKFGFSSNRLNGPFPEFAVNMSELSVFHASDNCLTGTLPSELVSLTSLKFMDFHENCLNGVIPFGIDALDGLLYLDLSRNSLTGPMFGTSTMTAVPRRQLRHLNFGWNHLTGSIPSSIGLLTNMNNLILNSNSFTGSLPLTIGFLSAGLRALFIRDNMITGSIPGALNSSFGELAYVVIGNNCMTGPIPAAFGGIRTLIELEIAGNWFTGTLDALADQNSTRFVNLLLNENQFTGTIPSALFVNPSLRTFIASLNCFHGTLPTTVCQSPLLELFVMDGLSSSPSCRNKLFPYAKSSYSLSHDESVYGGIPSCLFVLPSLRTLHLSGNAFTGRLPNVEMSPLLFDLSLSHNLFTGYIPEYVQLKSNWTNLDLSYNRFTGTLLHNYAKQSIPSSSLYLKNNRISGRIPGSLMDMETIAIMGSNLFSCSILKSDLPEHDADRFRYQCGSAYFEVSYLCWLGLFVIAVVLGLFVDVSNFVCCLGLNIRQTVNTWYRCCYLSDGTKDLATRRLENLFSLLDAFVVFAQCCCFYIVVVLLPLYCVLTYFYGTYTHEYAYYVSAAYLSGKVAFGWEFTLWVILLSLLLVLFKHVVEAHRQKERERSINVCCDIRNSARNIRGSRLKRTSSISGGLRQFTYLQQCFVYTIVISVNIIVVGGLNVAYVVASIYGNSSYLFLFQFVFSCFKILWNQKAISYVLKFGSEFAVGKGIVYESQLANLEMFVFLLNNILTPLFVVACISPNCFYNVFVPPETVGHTYTTHSFCIRESQDGTCRLYFPSETIDSEFDPPFTYSYQCSSSLVAYYAPAYVMMCIIGTFWLVFSDVMIYRQWLKAKRGTWWYWVCDLIVPNIHRLQVHDSDAPCPYKLRPFQGTFVRVNRLLALLGAYFGLLMTFGVMFPPLAVAISGTILFTVNYAKLEIGRFVCFDKEFNNAINLQKVESDCQVSVSLLGNLIWMILTICCIFYSLFLFDTLGDQVGFDDAYWILIVMLLLPLVVYVVHKVVRYYYSNATLMPDVNAKDCVEVEVELPTVPVPTASSVQSTPDPEGGASSEAEADSSDTINPLSLS